MSTYKLFISRTAFTYNATIKSSHTQRFESLYVYERNWRPFITASCILTVEEIIFVYPEPSNIILSLFLQSTYRKTTVVKKKRKEKKTKQKKYTEISCLNNIQKISCNIILSPNLY